MKKHYTLPDYTGVSTVVCGVTGETLSAIDHESRLTGEIVKRNQEHFVKGPISVSWIAKAINLTPSAVKTAIALCYQMGLSKSETFKLQPERFREFEINDTSRRRGLGALESAGLIQLTRAQSKAPIVTMVGAKPPTMSRIKNFKSNQKESK